MKLGGNAKEGAKKLGDGAKKMTETVTETVKVGSLKLGGQFSSFGRNKTAASDTTATSPNADGTNNLVLNDEDEAVDL
jgi:hypothetical protein